MGGIVRGKVECYINTSAGTVSANINAFAQTAFKIIYDFFSSHPNYTIIALQYGATSPLVTLAAAGSSGTGTGFWDQPNSFGYNAWFVARANATTVRPYDVYHLFQWSGSQNFSSPIFGNTPGNPGLALGSTNPVGSSNTYICHSCAIGIGGIGGSAISVANGNGNPWKGTTNANGTDTKGSIVWGAPSTGGTGVMIFPRSNSGNGSYRQLTQNMSLILSYAYGGSPGATRLNIIADDDSFCIFSDLSDNGNYNMTFNGLYTPRNGVTIPYPYCSISTYGLLPWSVTAQSVYGDIAGMSTQQGGIISPITASVFGLQLDHYSTFATDVNYWPNHASFATTTFDELDIPVGIYEPSPTQMSGLLGQIDFVREMFNVTTNQVKTDSSKIVIGSTTLADRKYFVPWDSQYKTPPRTGMTRNGISFIQS